MKKTIFLLPVIIILFLLFSCPSEVIKKTYWKGTIKGNFNDIYLKTRHDLEIYFRNDDTCRIIIIFKMNEGDESEYALSGKYTLKDKDYSFSAEVEDEDRDFVFEFNGTLNTLTGEGEGEVEWVESGDIDINEKEEWTAEKVY